MKFSVLINSYNCAQYLRECVDSVLAQTRQPDEIIIVDDGSTDSSLQVLQEHYGRHPLVRIISQVNQGQIMAIGVGIENATGDILCLLDCDDRYKPHYLEELEALYTAKPHLDLVFCRFEALGENPRWDNEGSLWLLPRTSYDYGRTALLTYFLRTTWIGNVTSTISLRRQMARVLNLIEVAQNTYTSVYGDYPILTGTSLMGGVKYYLYRELIDYRFHDQSNSLVWLGTNRSQHQQKFVTGLIENYYRKRSCITEDMRKLLPKEALTIPAPLPAHLDHYKVPNPPPFHRKLRSAAGRGLREFLRAI